MSLIGRITTPYMWTCGIVRDSIDMKWIGLLTTSMLTRHTWSGFAESIGLFSGVLFLMRMYWTYFQKILMSNSITVSGTPMDHMLNTPLYMTEWYVYIYHCSMPTFSRYITHTLVILREWSYIDV